MYLYIKCNSFYIHQYGCIRLMPPIGRALLINTTACRLRAVYQESSPGKQRIFASPISKFKSGGAIPVQSERSRNRTRPFVNRAASDRRCEYYRRWNEQHFGRIDPILDRNAGMRCCWLRSSTPSKRPSRPRTARSACSVVYYFHDNAHFFTRV